MFCEKCGNKNDESHKFCIKCGHPAIAVIDQCVKSNLVKNLEERWWHRLFKVIYVMMYIQILWIVPVVWTINDTSSDYYGGQFHYEATTGLAFWYSILTLVIYISVLRLIKIAVLYILFAQKPEWKKEFKRLY
jgi:hypothetical protein